MGRADVPSADLLRRYCGWSRHPDGAGYLLSETVDEEVIVVMNDCVCGTVKEQIKQLVESAELQDFMAIVPKNMADTIPAGHTRILTDDGVKL